MSDHTKSTQDHPKTHATAGQHGDQRDTDKRAEDRSSTTGAQPGMAQRNEQAKPTGNTDDRTEQAGPNPGPGVSSQGHRVDESTPAHGNEQDADRKQPNSNKDMPSSDKPRDRDKDRKDPMGAHGVGNK
jgi:hypothetical protein